MNSLKIAVIVHGRFHAFDLAKALLREGSDVILFTNYPLWAVKRFGFPVKRVRSFWAHGILTRLVDLVWQEEKPDWVYSLVLRIFGRWVAQEVSKESWDALYCFSQVAEEVFRSIGHTKTLKLLLRSSAHIRVMHSMLQEQGKRLGFKVKDGFGPWMIAREEKEYALSDFIVVSSSFVYDTFLEAGTPKDRLFQLNLGVDVSAFRPSREIIDARVKRILSGDKLRLLYVGSMRFHKGVHDLIAVVKSLPRDRFDFRLVGPAHPSMKVLLNEIKGMAEYIPQQPQQKLFLQYAWGDLFIFPTLQDGFGVVLAQAYANALAIVSTQYCCGPDFIENGLTGWVVDGGDRQAFIDRFLWADSHRGELAELVRRVYAVPKIRDWQDVARDLAVFSIEKAVLQKERVRS